MRFGAISPAVRVRGPLHRWRWRRRRPISLRFSSLFPFFFFFLKNWDVDYSSSQTGCIWLWIMAANNGALFFMDFWIFANYYTRQRPEMARLSAMKLASSAAISRSIWKAWKWEEYSRIPEESQKNPRRIPEESQWARHINTNQTM